MKVSTVPPRLPLQTSLDTSTLYNLQCKQNLFIAEDLQHRQHFACIIQWSWVSGGKTQNVLFSYLKLRSKNQVDQITWMHRYGAHTRPWVIYATPIEMDTMSKCGTFPWSEAASAPVRWSSSRACVRVRGSPSTAPGSSWAPQPCVQRSDVLCSGRLDVGWLWAGWRALRIAIKRRRRPRAHSREEWRGVPTAPSQLHSSSITSPSQRHHISQTAPAVKGAGAAAWTMLEARSFLWLPPGTARCSRLHSLSLPQELRKDITTQFSFWWV